MKSAAWPPSRIGKPVGASRLGDKLYTAAIVAVEGATGELKWLAV